MDTGNARQQIVESIKSTSNILVTVSTNPSVDELSAALGLTILLNKMEKRATAVVSGDIPPAITFLDPGKTFQSTVNSLRDFIIALDKEKADHLRYKIEGDVVKIFITPYRTTLSNKDLDFSQGDYNVEMVIALGVKDQDRLDTALLAHGRILHDATVATICASPEGSALGSIDWFDPSASSLCEMLVGLSEALKGDTRVLDERISTALLTGIVSATDRFSNNKTSSKVMTMAAQLMAAGANQQLIAAKLEEAHEIGPKSTANKAKTENGDGTFDLNDDQTTKLGGQGNAKKNDKKSKKQDNTFSIHRSQPQPESTPPVMPVVESNVPPQPKLAEELNPIIDAVPPSPDATPVVDQQSAVQAAMESALPAIDAEQELAQQLANVVPPQTQFIPADIQSELSGAPKAASETPAAGSSSDMPGFEQTGTTLSNELLESVLTPPSSEIINHNSSEYVHAEDQLNYGGQGASDELEKSNRPEGMIAKIPTIDPFSVPLPPLDTTQQTSQLDQSVFDQLDSSSPTVLNTPPVEFNQPATPLQAVVPEIPPAFAQAPIELPPLPPMPDFSTLPPLPPLPALPTFDSDPSVAPTGGMSSEQLGNIFGDTPPLPTIPDSEPVKPTSPPEPGQFRIPGQ